MGGGIVSSVSLSEKPEAHTSNHNTYLAVLDFHKDKEERISVILELAEEQDIVTLGNHIHHEFLFPIAELAKGKDMDPKNFIYADKALVGMVERYRKKRAEVHCRDMKWFKDSRRDRFVRNFTLSVMRVRVIDVSRVNPVHTALSRYAETYRYDL